MKQKSRRDLSLEQDSTIKYDGLAIKPHGRECAVKYEMSLERCAAGRQVVNVDARGRLES
jgi:hypothetical protein